jgi:hypothetical protein
MMVTYPVSLPSAAGWGSELLRVLANRAARGGLLCACSMCVHAIRRRPGRRRPFEVRWHAAGRARSRSFITRGLAEGYRAELIRAARRGLDFSPVTGEPARWAGPQTPGVSWLEHASAYAVMKWPHSAAHTRASIADALATVTPALLTPGNGTPPVRLLRTALYQQAFTQAGPGSDPGAPITAALAWARRHSLPVSALADPRVIRRALDCLTLRLDGNRAAAATIARSGQSRVTACATQPNWGCWKPIPSTGSPGVLRSQRAWPVHGPFPDPLKYRRSWPRSPGCAQSWPRSSAASTTPRCARPKPSRCGSLTATCHRQGGPAYAHRFPAPHSPRLDQHP